MKVRAEESLARFVLNRMLLANSGVFGKVDVMLLFGTFA
jgi:hypothetical protein